MTQPPLSAWVEAIEAYVSGSSSDQEFAGAYFGLHRILADRGGRYPQPGADHAISNLFFAIDESWFMNSQEAFPDWHFLTHDELLEEARKSLEILKPLVEAPESPDWPRQREELDRESLAADLLKRRSKGPIVEPGPNPHMQSLLRKASEEAERLGHYWVGTGHLFIALANDRDRCEYDYGIGDGLLALDEVAPGWQEKVTERLGERWSKLEAAVERLRRAAESGS